MLDLWSVYHPYVNHILFGVVIGFISFKVFQKLGYIKNKKRKYLLPTIATAILLILFKFYESTLPPSTPTFIPGVFLNANHDTASKIFRGVITIFFGFLSPNLDGVFKKVMSLKFQVFSRAPEGI